MTILATVLDISRYNCSKYIEQLQRRSNSQETDMVFCDPDFRAPALMRQTTPMSIFTLFTFTLDLLVSWSPRKILIGVTKRNQIEEQAREGVENNESRMMSHKLKFMRQKTSKDSFSINVNSIM